MPGPFAAAHGDASPTVSGLSARSLDEGVHAIRLDNAVFEGENVVYLLDPRDGPTTLVDAGVPTPDARADLEAGLDAAGVAVADLDRILLTHWHWDHSGLAGALQAESGATVHVHERDAPLVDGTDRAAFEERRRDCFEAWGIPEEPRTELAAFLDGHADLAGEPAAVSPFEDGDRFALGDDGALRAVHLPGHADGLCAFAVEAGEHGLEGGESGRGGTADGQSGSEGAEDGQSGRGGTEDALEDGEAFVGDAILPEYTPNVGGADPRVDSPVATYAASLRRLADLELDRAWPGHRDPIDDPAGRAEEILAHHERRTERTRDALARIGPATPWAVARELFGDLEGIHVMHGPGEAWAHLEHLRERDEARRRREGGRWTYEVDRSDAN